MCALCSAAISRGKETGLLWRMMFGTTYPRSMIELLMDVCSGALFGVGASWSSHRLCSQIWRPLKAYNEWLLVWLTAPR